MSSVPMFCTDDRPPMKQVRASRNAEAADLDTHQDSSLFVGSVYPEEKKFTRRSCKSEYGWRKFPEKNNNKLKARTEVVVLRKIMLIANEISSLEFYHTFLL